jgi:alginate O-acetyltransferase complex protein AlgJ
LDRHQRIHALRDTLTTLLFVVAICLPAAGLIFHWHVMREEDENRRLATLPPLSTNPATLGRFPEAFTAYFNDNFGFRPTLIRWQALVRFRVFGVSASPLVIVGKNGWLFLVSEYSANGTHLVPPFTAGELEGWRRLLEGRRDWLRQRGIRYLYTIFPRKEVIYPDYLPDSFRPDSESRLDQLTRYLKEHSDVEILDLRPALLEARKRHDVYFKTDTHWNFYGGLAGYQAIGAELSKSFSRPKPVNESDCNVLVQARDTDLIRLMGLTGYLKEDVSVLRMRQPGFRFVGTTISVSDLPINAHVSENKATDLPRLVLFGDSANGALIPFLPQHFSHAVFVFLPRIDPILVESEHPDIVIQEMGELGLTNGANPDLTEVENLKSGGKGKTVTQVTTGSH